MKKEQPNNDYNFDLVTLAKPIILNIPAYFRRDIFDKQSLMNILMAARCPASIAEQVITNCVLAGLLKPDGNGNYQIIPTDKE